MPQKPISLGHGKGSISKRCERAGQTRCKHEWHIRYRINNRPREEGSDKGWTRRQAEGSLKEINKAECAGMPVEHTAARSVPSFEGFTSDKRHGRIDPGKNTQRNCRSILDNHVYPELGRLPMNRIARNPSPPAPPRVPSAHQDERDADVLLAAACGDTLGVPYGPQ